MDPARARGDGLLALSADVDTDLLFEAYSFGIFPWPQDIHTPILWFSPPYRGVLDFADLHVGQALKKVLRKHPYDVTFNQAFTQVMTQCARVPRPGQDGTWILPSMITAYTDFHAQGYAHSVECWHAGRLVGGIYGVYVGGVFSAESMFHLESNASKVALMQLIARLQAIQASWLDIQMVTPHMEAMGAKEIPRQVFLRRLARDRRGEMRALVP
jgi:leucyl/phenylalanyl-tRNA--protein transferase